MGLVSKLKNEYKGLKESNPLRNPELLLFKRIWGVFWRIVLGKWFLRNCQTGSLCTTRGIPRIDSNGEIILGNRVKIWSHIHKTQLSAGGKGKLIIGDNTFINVGSIISAQFQIKIGKNVQIAPGVIMMDSDFHGVEDRDAEVTPTPITIGDDVWLATRVVVLKGVTIGEGSTIATGAVVTKDIPAYSIAAGNPARVIKKYNHETKIWEKA
ncbi:MAG: acetyltransferase-like isoleucine patch superfamily enzyme [Urechidicola sp.]|jgi:acetyltransferase-like isoleucine patch superfamily enzyme